MKVIIFVMLAFNVCDYSKEIDFMQSQLGWKLKTADTLMEV